MRRWKCRSMLAAGCGLGFALASASGQDSRPLPDSVKVKPAEAPRRLSDDILVIPGTEKRVEAPSLELPGLKAVSVKSETPEPEKALELPGLKPLPVKSESPEPAKLPELPSLEPPKLEGPKESTRKPHTPPPIRPISVHAEDVKAPVILPRHIREKDEKGVERIGVDFEPKKNDSPLLLPDPATLKATPVKNTKAEKAPKGESLKLPEQGKIVVSSPPTQGKTDGAAPAAAKPFWDSGYDPNKHADKTAVETMSRIETVKPREMWWVNISYLQWFIDQGSSPAIGVGAFPVPGSTAVGRSFPFVPDGKTTNRSMPGIDIKVGTWLEPNFRWGIEATSLTLFDQTQKRYFSSPGDVFILRPFVDAGTGNTVLSQVAGGGNRSGLLATSSSQCLQGEELHALYNFRGGFIGGAETPDAPLWSVHFQAGYRFLQYRNSLAVRDVVTLAQGPADGPYTFATRDNFDCTNEFHGGQVGVRGRYESNRWTLDLQGKLAIGNMEQTVDVYGASMSMTPGIFSDRTGGFLALGSNSGTYVKQTAMVIPELAANLGLKLSRNALLTVGYNVLYIPQVVRAGDQIDPVINPGFLPYGPAASSMVARPAFRMNDSSLWAQGISVGLTLQY